MSIFVAVDSPSDIFTSYRNTPIASLLEYQNLGYPFQTYTQAQLLIGMCMDNRKMICLPDGFAYILRTGGGNLRYSEFKVSYAIAVGGVSAIALLAHNHCGMVDLHARRGEFIQGLVERAGWTKEQAEDHFLKYAETFEIEDEIKFVLSEAKRLRNRYPKVLVAPLLYRLEDNRLYQLRES